MTGRNVWLASYPKSGNTWLRAVYSALRRGAGPDINQLGGMGPASRTVFDTALGLRASDLTPGEVEVLRPRADELAAAEMTDDVWRKIHDALFSGPGGETIVSLRATRIALYLVRDPRDVAVSYAHHAELTPAEAVQCLCSSTFTLGRTERGIESQLQQRLGSWSEHVRSWTEHPPFPVHVLRYEDCVADPVTTFGAAFAAAGLVTSEEDLARAVERCSFRRLQELETSEGFSERLSPNSRFFRRGAVGSWKDELTAELARRLAEEHSATMARFGYLP